jgi:hypothetical protein
MKWELTMRVRTFVFALVCGTATAALAQDGGYVRFPSSNAQACAASCASDQMCASWSFGSAARSYGQNTRSAANEGMCTFSGSSVVRNSPGFVSGLPRRDALLSNVPMMSAPPPANNQSFSGPIGRPNTQSSTNGGGWNVRPAPWLNNSGASPSNGFNSGQAGLQPQPQPQPQQATGQPQQLRPVPAMPSVTPSLAPRIEYEAQQRPAPQYSPPQTNVPPFIAPARQPVPQPIMRPAPAPVFVPAPATQPTYTPPPAAAYTPPPQQPGPITFVPPPAPPPGTREVSASGETAAPTRPRGARGMPKARAVVPAEAAPAQAGNEVQVTLPSRPAPARGTPRSSVPVVAPSAEASASTGAAPPRQETASRPTASRAAPRPPVRDPSDPESFRGADGMIDAAEMRRAQLNAAREQGTPAYSVQREWEAVETERQRAAAAGEVRVDPLAGTSPVPPPPETRAERRAREAEETAEAAAEAATEARAQTRPDADEVSPTQTRPAARGARGVPRPRAAPQTSENASPQQVAERSSQTRANSARRAPAQSLDREPRLSGGPG